MPEFTADEWRWIIFEISVPLIIIVAIICGTIASVTKTRHGIVDKNEKQLDGYQTMTERNQGDE